MDFYENRLVFLANDQDDSPEQPQITPEETIAEQREEIVEESQLDRVDMALEQKETVEQIIGDIDINLPPEQQQDAIDTLESTCHIMLARLFQKKEYNPERVQQEILLIENTPGKNRAEKAAIRKIKKILENPECEMFLWLGEWPEIVDMSHQTYEFAKAKEEEIRETNGKKGTWGNRLVTAGLVVGGAVAGYHLVKWLWKKTKKHRDKAATKVKEVATPERVKKAGWFAKALGIAGGVAGALGIATIGACLLSPDEVGKWVSDHLGFNFSKESFSEFWKLIKQGKVGEAFAAFSASVEVHHPFIAEAAETIGMEPKNLLLLKDSSYKKFMSLGDQISRGTDAALSFLMSDVELPLLFSGKEKMQALKDEATLHKFFRAHAEDIKDIEPKETIEDVLIGLKEKGKLERVVEPEEPEEKEGGGLDIRSNLPHVQAAIDKANERLANGEPIEDVIGDLVDEAIDGAVQDGGAVIASEAGVHVYKAGKWTLLTSINSIVQGFIAGIATRDPKEAAIAYWEAGGWAFTAIGASVGLVQGLKNRGLNPFVAVDVAKGAGKGFAAPGKILYEGGKESLMMTKRGVDSWYILGEKVKPTPAQKVEWYHARAKFHAKQYKYYHDILYADSEAATTLQKGKRWAQREGQPKWIERNLHYHGRKLFRASTDYRAAAGLPERPEGVVWKDDRPTSHDAAKKEANRFLEGGKFETMQIASEAEIEAVARKMAKDAGKPENQWEEYKKQARAKIEREKFQPKPRKAPTAEARAHLKRAKGAPATKMVEGGFGELELAKGGFTASEAEVIQKLSKLGVTDDAIFRMKELGWGEAQMRNIATQLEKEPGSIMKLEKMMTEEMMAKYRPYLKNAAKYGGPIVVILVLHGYDEADDKVEYLTKTGAEFGAFAGGAKLTHMTVGNKLMGKGWQGTVGALILDLAGGSAAALGVDAVWDETGGYLLDRYYPDRAHKKSHSPKEFARDLHAEAVLMSFGGGAAVNSAEFAIDSAFRVGPNTDPIEYLQKEMKFVNVYSQEWHKGMFKDYEIHNIETMEKKAGKTLERKRNKLAEKEAALTEAEAAGDTEKVEKLTKKIEKLKEQIEYVETLADGSWIPTTIGKLSLHQELFLRPANEEFRRLAAAKFEGGGEIYDKIIKDVLSENAVIKDDQKRRDVWNFLLDEKVETIEGKKMSFRDFMMEAKITEDRLEFMEGYAPPELKGHVKLLDEI